MKFEELPMREYLMYAMGAYHAKDFEEYNKQFIQTFMYQPKIKSNEEKEDKAEDEKSP